MVAQRMIHSPPSSEGLRLPVSFDRLPATIRLAIPLDDDELYAVCQRYADLKIERNADGELIIMPPTAAGRLRARAVGCVVSSPLAQAPIR